MAASPKQRSPHRNVKFCGVCISIARRRLASSDDECQVLCFILVCKFPCRDLFSHFLVKNIVLPYLIVSTLVHKAIVSIVCLTCIVEKELNNTSIT